jgi:acyl carrier protein
MVYNREMTTIAERGRSFLMNQTAKLKAAFVTAIGISAESDFDSVAYGKTTGWDSVAHMALVAEIELAFDIMLDTDDVIGMSSFPVAKTLLGKYGISFE